VADGRLTASHRERPWWSILSRPVNAVRQQRENSQ